MVPGSAAEQDMQQQTEPGSDAAAAPAAVSDSQGDASPPAFGGVGELPSTIQAHPGAGSEYLSPDGTPMRDDLTPNYSLTADVPSREALSEALRGREIDLASRLRLQAQQRGAGRNHDDVASMLSDQTDLSLSSQEGEGAHDALQAGGSGGGLAGLQQKFTLAVYNCLPAGI